MVVLKPDGGTDFKKVNVISFFDAFPMPHIEEMLEKSGQAEFISTPDLTKGYCQISMALEDKIKKCVWQNGVYSILHACPLACTQQQHPSSA